MRITENRNLTRPVPNSYSLLSYHSQAFTGYVPSPCSLLLSSLHWICTVDRSHTGHWGKCREAHTGSHQLLPKGMRGPRNILISRDLFFGQSYRTTLLRLGRYLLGSSNLPASASQSGWVFRLTPPHPREKHQVVCRHTHLPGARHDTVPHGCIPQQCLLTPGHRWETLRSWGSCTSRCVSASPHTQ